MPGEANFSHAGERAYPDPNWYFGMRDWRVQW